MNLQDVVKETQDLSSTIERVFRCYDWTCTEASHFLPNVVDCCHRMQSKIAHINADNDSIKYI